MNEPERELRQDADPDVGSERQWTREATARREVGLDDQLGVDLPSLQHDRPRDEVVRVGARGARDQQQHRKRSHARTLPLLLLVACHYDVGQADSAFYNWDDRKVHCAIDIDTYARIDNASIDTGLDRARDRGEVLELYNHDPGVTVQEDVIEHVLAGAQSRGLAFVTYADMANGVRPAGGGLAYSFDDAYVKQWVALRPLFQQYGARITFFIAYWDQLSAVDRASLHDLAADGHDIEAHTAKHYRGPVYVEQRGLGAYMSDEVQPSIDHLRDDGFTISAFAYPYGARTDETDRAILERVPILRSVAYTWDSPATDPCPND